jgi:hypothetical protein
VDVKSLQKSLQYAVQQVQRLNAEIEQTLTQAARDLAMASGRIPVQGAVEKHAKDFFVPFENVPAKCSVEYASEKQYLTGVWNQVRNPRLGISLRGAYYYFRAVREGTVVSATSRILINNNDVPVRFPSLKGAAGNQPK